MYELRFNVIAIRDPEFLESLLSIVNGTAVETIVDDVPKIVILHYFWMTNQIVADIFSNYAAEQRIKEPTAT